MLALLGVVALGLAGFLAVEVARRSRGVSGGPTIGAAVVAKTPAPSTTRSATARLRVRRAAYPLPGAVEREVAVVAGERVVLAGGLDAAGTSVAGVFALDPATGRLALLGTVPQPFHDAAGVLLGHALYVFGGGPSTGTDAVQRFDLRSRSSAIVGHLPRPLSDLAAATVGGTVYLVGGFDGSRPRAEVLATRDGRRFRLAARLPTGLRYAAVAAAGSHLVVAGGESASGDVPGVWLVDTTSGRVSSLGKLPAPLAHATAVSLGGDVYVLGGRDPADNALRTVYRIDPASRTIRRLRPLARPVADAAAAVLAPGSALLLGGWRGTPVTDVLELRTG